MGSDPELSHRDGRLKVNNDDIDAGKYRDRETRRRQDRYDQEQEEDDSDREDDNRRKLARGNRDSGERGRDSPGGQSIEFYDDGYEARRIQPWDRREQQRPSVKNSQDHSLYLSPRNNNLNDSFSSSRPSRLESIPEAGQNIGSQSRKKNNPLCLKKTSLCFYYSHTSKYRA